jgi:hypothetical protein
MNHEFFYQEQLMLRDQYINELISAFDAIRGHLPDDDDLTGGESYAVSRVECIRRDMRKLEEEE